MSDTTTEVDPLQAVLESHFAAMKEISAGGLAKSQELCDETLLGIKKNAGLRSKMADQALAALGITSPAEEATA